MNNVIEMNTLDTAHEKLTDRYKVVKTKEIAQKFKDMGFMVDSFQQKNVRSIDKRGFQKHLVRLSNPSLLSFKGDEHKDIKLQLLVTNSHDGTTAFRMQLGFFRFVCSNGMVVGETFESISLRHSGSVLDQIDGAIERIVAQVGQLNETLHRLKNTKLTAAQEMSFVNEAVKLRSGKLTLFGVPARRGEDQGNDLFTVLNRVQESMIRGGDQASNSIGRVRQLRAIKNIDREVKLNKEIFDLALKYAA